MNGEDFPNEILDTDEPIDVFAQAGCESALVLTHDFVLRESEMLNITFNSIVENPMVSVIEVTELCFPPTPAPTFNLLPSCIPISGACVESAAELQEAVSQAMEGDTIAICGGATMDTSATGQIEIFQTGLTLCCAGGRGDCVFKNDGTSRNLYVKADAISMRATSTFMEASLPDHILGGTSICGRWALAAYHPVPLK